MTSPHWATAGDRVFPMSPGRDTRELKVIRQYKSSIRKRVLRYRIDQKLRRAKRVVDMAALDWSAFHYPGTDTAENEISQSSTGS